MAACEFRIGTVGNLNIAPVGEMSAAASFPICKIMAEGPEAWMPKCELPDFSTEQCPIAQFQLGKMDLATTNIRLEKIFTERRAAAAPQPLPVKK